MSTPSRHNRRRYLFRGLISAISFRDRCTESAVQVDRPVLAKGGYTVDVTVPLQEQIVTADDLAEKSGGELVSLGNW